MFQISTYLRMCVFLRKKITARARMQVNSTISRTWELEMNSVYFSVALLRVEFLEAVY